MCRSRTAEWWPRSDNGQGSQAGRGDFFKLSLQGRVVVVSFGDWHWEWQEMPHIQRHYWIKFSSLSAPTKIEELTTGSDEKTQRSRAGNRTQGLANSVSSFIFVGADHEREGNLIRNDPDKSEFTTLLKFKAALSTCFLYLALSKHANETVFSIHLLSMFFFFFLLKVQTPERLCVGELFSILVVRLAHSADSSASPCFQRTMCALR